MKKIFNNRPGSALLIALFVMSTVGVIAFGSTRLYISEIHSTDNLTQTPQAYYAAESALEDGLLAYRQNANSQWSDSCLPDNSSNCLVTNSSNFAQLPDLTNGEKAKVKMYYLGQKLDNTKGLKKDDSVVINLNPNLASEKLTWVWDNPASCSNYGLRISYIDENGKQDNNINNLSQIFLQSSQLTASLSSASAKSVIIRPINCSLASYQITNPGGNDPIDTGLTTIDSIGQYNNVNRELRATLDRSTGQLKGVFDYTLFGSESGIK
jgi:hypothetical protein